MEGALDEVRDEAIPFRDGDEVFVTIVEPHMYEVDDAVAKIDGYIVSVAGGGPFVGEKRLVRILEAGRTAATAVLVGAQTDGAAGGEGSGGGEGSEDDALESKRRRRGRRGGRRRSAAATAAEATPAD